MSILQFCNNIIEFKMFMKISDESESNNYFKKFDRYF